MDENCKEIKRIFVSDDAFAQLSNGETKEYIKRLGENALRENSGIRSKNKPLQELQGAKEFDALAWESMKGNAHFSTDLMKEKISQAANSLQRQKDEVYRQAIGKHFGEFTEDNAKKCSLVFDKGVERLMHGEKILCEMYPPEQPSFPGSTATYQITYTQRYRIF